MDNINEIISSLSADDIEMLKGVASSVLGGNDNSTSQNEISQPMIPQETASGGNMNMLSAAGLNSGDLQMIMKAKQIFDKMNSQSSKNVVLINALKPHLSEESRIKADQAIRIMQLFEALPYIKDLF